MFSVYNSTWLYFVHAPVKIIGSTSKIQRNTDCFLNVCGWASWVSSYLYIVENVYKFSYVITLAFSIFFFRFRNAMLKSICEVLDLERSGVNSELVKRILNFLMHPKPSGKVRINFYYFSNKSIIFSLPFLCLFFNEHFNS